MQASLPPEMLQRLTECLDRQIELLGARSDELDALTKAVCANDNDRMEKVLEAMEQSRQRQDQADREFKGARDKLAEHLGWQVDQTRLHRLLEMIREPQRQALAKRRQQVVVLADALRQKHRQTSMLLSECSRINSMLIDCILGKQERVTVYGAAGTQHWRGCGSLMDTER